jgi:hypothetical protein
MTGRSSSPPEALFWFLTMELFLAQGVNQFLEAAHAQEKPHHASRLRA